MNSSKSADFISVGPPTTVHGLEEIDIPNQTWDAVFSRVGGLTRPHRRGTRKIHFVRVVDVDALDPRQNLPDFEKISEISVMKICAKYRSRHPDAEAFYAVVDDTHLPRRMEPDRDQTPLRGATIVFGRGNATVDQLRARVMDLYNINRNQR